MYWGKVNILYVRGLNLECSAHSITFAFKRTIAQVVGTVRVFSAVSSAGCICGTFQQKVHGIATWHPTKVVTYDAVKDFVSNL